MWKILILHGPNLNLLGKREPDIYGNLSLDDIDKRLVIAGHELCMEVRAYQSNVEGVLIDQLHAAREWASGVIINPGGYTHTSVALRDAVKASGLPTIEVHLTNIYAREEFRHTSLIAPVCVGKIVGFGWRSYLLALTAMRDILVAD